ncbi:hypothetical protein [Tissierella praeacuta]|nr:hypothetical protein [Tissierella praeacuta]
MSWFILSMELNIDIFIDLKIIVYEVISIKQSSDLYEYFNKSL